MISKIETWNVEVFLQKQWVSGWKNHATYEDAEVEKIQRQKEYGWTEQNIRIVRLIAEDELIDLRRAAEQAAEALKEARYGRSLGKRSNAVIEAALASLAAVGVKS